MVEHLSIHGQIVEAIRRGVLDGRYRSRLPSEAQIATRFKCSRKTAVRAMEQLQWEGVVVRRKGKGSFVSKEFRTVGRSVGLIVLSYSEIFPSVCREVARLCQDGRYMLMLGQITSGDPKVRARRAKDLAANFIDQNVAGVIIQPIGFLPDADALNADIVDMFRRRGTPVVLIDGDIVPVPERSECDTVEIDNYEAGWRLARHVLERCHGGRIVFFTRPDGPHSNDLRWQGVRSAAESADRDAELLVCEQDDGPRLKRALRRRDVSAVICGYDALAVAAANALRSIGRRIPDDVLLAGFDDISIASAMTPRLTTIHQPCEQLAEAAYEALVRRIAEPKSPPQRILLHAPLVERESTSGGNQRRRKK